MAVFEIKKSSFAKFLDIAAMVVVTPIITIICAVALKSAGIPPLVGLIAAPFVIFWGVSYYRATADGIFFDTEKDIVSFPKGKLIPSRREIPLSQISSVNMHQERKVVKNGDSTTVVYTDIVTMAGIFGSEILKFPTAKGKSEEFLAKLNAAREHQDS